MRSNFCVTHSTCEHARKCTKSTSFHTQLEKSRIIPCAQTISIVCLPRTAPMWVGCPQAGLTDVEALPRLLQHLRWQIGKNDHGHDPQIHNATARRWSFSWCLCLLHFIARYRSRSLEIYIAVSCSIMNSYHGLGPKVLSLNVVYVHGKIFASSVTCPTCLLGGKTIFRTPRV